MKLSDIDNKKSYDGSGDSIDKLDTPTLVQSSFQSASNKRKTRFDGIDVSAMVAHLGATLLGNKVVNIYDGSNDKTFLIKLAGMGNLPTGTSKQILLLESGIRFHPTSRNPNNSSNVMPSGFTMKLRKHLRNLRLESLQQLGNLDRVVDFRFGSGAELSHHLILELYAQGNLILTNAQYEILALLRNHEYKVPSQIDTKINIVHDNGTETHLEKSDVVKVRVGQVYPVSLATTLTTKSDVTTSMDWPKNLLEFSTAIDEFFTSLESKKTIQKADKAEKAIESKLDKIKRDQEFRLRSLEQEQEELQLHAALLELHAPMVDQALAVVNSALNNAMSWEALDQLIEVEKNVNHNPVAMLIVEIRYENDDMVLALQDTISNYKEEEEKSSDVQVTVSLHHSAHGNATVMYDRYRQLKEKHAKTVKSSAKALKAVEATAHKHLDAAQQTRRLASSVKQQRKPHWFEKFHWFITSDNYMVVGGRDSQQNELLVKRYLRTGDAYLHADVHGASSCILRAKRRRLKNGSTQVLPLSEIALREAGSFTICRSAAWNSKMITSAWWVEAHQVSKTAPTGEYLTLGSFMIRGKKNFLPASQLELGLAVLFRLGDESSIARHVNERRDFSLYLAPECDETPDDEQTAVQHNPETTNFNSINESQEAEMSEVLIREESPQHGSSIADQDELPLQVAEGRESMNRSCTIINDNHASDNAPPKKQGLSARDRKVLKKYGSMEAARDATEAREKDENSRTIKPINNNQESAIYSRNKMVRGKRAKMKKLALKYADQDEEDRELAMRALHGGEMKKTKDRQHLSKLSLTETQQAIANETKSLLIKDSAHLAKSLAVEVHNVLALCISTDDQVNWEKIDGYVLEQLHLLEHNDQVAAVNRLLELSKTTSIHNVSASLSGIIRTIHRYGSNNLSAVVDSKESRNLLDKSTKESENESLREISEQDRVMEILGEVDAVDDRAELSMLTGTPTADDLLLYAIPVCAPYASLTKYTYKVKLTPGSLKRGKAVKQCLETYSELDKAYGGKNPYLNSSLARNRDLIRAIPDHDWLQCIIGDVKISAPGSSKSKKKG